MLCLIACAALSTQSAEWLVFEGAAGPGKGKRIVFLTGDEEYRSEEGLPQLAKILARRHGFQCTVLFSIGKQGEIDPNERANEPGMEALDNADLCVMLLRFREWPDAQMSHFVNYYLAGKPIIALRTSTHAFDYRDGSTSPYRQFGWRSKDWASGFGKQVLGETWISHWGNHGAQATRGIASGSKNPIMRGVRDVFCTTDVYEASPPPDAEILLRGQVLAGMAPQDPPAEGRKKTAGGTEQPLNDPMMPIAWVRSYRNQAGKTNKVLTCTMGAATDLQNEGLRRMLVNGAYWAVGLAKKIPAQANVDLVGEYNPSPFGFDGFKKGIKPADLK
jgi:hypothetical protein